MGTPLVLQVLAAESNALYSTSNAVFVASNAAYPSLNTSTYASNAGVTYSNLAFIANTFTSNLTVTSSNSQYAQIAFASNATFWGSNLAASVSNAGHLQGVFASNAAFASSNSAVSASNWTFRTSNVLMVCAAFTSNTAVAASNAAWTTSNLARDTSNGIFQMASFGSNAAVHASNVAVSTSNVALATSNTLFPASTSTCNAAVFTSNTAIFASNQAAATSNAAVAMVAFTTSTAASASNVGQATSNSSTGTSNLTFGCLTFASNTTTTTLNAANAASNMAAGSSNALTPSLLFASNAGLFAASLRTSSSNALYLPFALSSNAASFASNASAFASLLGSSSSNVLSPQSASAAATAAFACNLAVVSSNQLFVQLPSASNDAVFASNTAGYASALAAIVTADMTSAAVTCNTAVDTSNTGTWTSNALTGLSNLAASIYVPTAMSSANISNAAFWASNQSANANPAALQAAATYASNQAVAASNAAVAASNFAASTQSAYITPLVPTAMQLSNDAIAVRNVMIGTSNAAAYASNLHAARLPDALSASVSNAAVAASNQAADASNVAFANAANASGKFLVATCNLSDLGNRSLALSNLGLSTASNAPTYSVSSITAERFLAGSNAAGVSLALGGFSNTGLRLLSTGGVDVLVSGSNCLSVRTGAVTIAGETLTLAGQTVSLGGGTWPSAAYSVESADAALVPAAATTTASLLSNQGFVPGGKTTVARWSAAVSTGTPASTALARPACAAVAVDGSCNVFVAGNLASRWTDSQLGQGLGQLYDLSNAPSATIEMPAAASNAGGVAFLARYDSNGILRGLASVSDGLAPSVEHFRALAVTGCNEIVAGGLTSACNSALTHLDGTAAAVSYNAAALGASNQLASVVLYRANGTVAWASAVRVPPTSDQNNGVRALAVEPTVGTANSVFATGAYPAYPAVETMLTASTSADLTNALAIARTAVSGNAAYLARFSASTGAPLMLAALDPGANNSVSSTAMALAPQQGSTGLLCWAGTVDDTSNPAAVFQIVRNTGSVTYERLSLRRTAVGARSGLLVCLSYAGAPAWAATVEGANLAVAAVDATGNLYAAGYTNAAAGNVSFYDPGPALSSNAAISGAVSSTSGGVTAFLAKWNSNGVAQWAAPLTGAGASNVPSGLVYDVVSGHMVLTGAYGPDTSLTLYSAAVGSAGYVTLNKRTGASSTSAFLARYDPSDGTLLSAMTCADGGSAVGPVMATGPDGALAVGCGFDTGPSAPTLLHADSRATDAPVVRCFSQTGGSAAAVTLYQTFALPAYKLLAPSTRFGALGQRKIVVNTSSLPATLALRNSNDTATLSNVTLMQDERADLVWVGHAWAFL